MTVRDPRENPLHHVDSRKHPDVQKRRAAFKDALELEERPPVSSTDVGEERDHAAVDRVENQVSDGLRNGVEPFRGQNLSRRRNYFGWCADVRLGQLDYFERLTKRDV